MQLLALTRDREPAVRAAATRAVLFWHVQEAAVLPAIAERLGDDSAIVRLIAADTLRACGTNAVQALPALRAAFEAEPSRPRGAEIPDESYPCPLSAGWLRGVMQEAMRAIDPSAPSPRESR